jgi:hypothetical protein
MQAKLGGHCGTSFWLCFTNISYSAIHFDVRTDLMGKQRSSDTTQASARIPKCWNMLKSVAESVRLFAILLSCFASYDSINF